MIHLTVEQLSADPRDPRDDVGPVANVGGALSIDATGQTVCSEVAFPVVELALALERWRRARQHTESNFEFDSMSAEGRGLVWIRRSEGGWCIGSVAQGPADTPTFSTEEIDGAMDAYLAQLADLIGEAFGEEWIARLRRLFRQ